MKPGTQSRRFTHVFKIQLRFVLKLWQKDQDADIIVSQTQKVILFFASS